MRTMRWCGERWTRLLLTCVLCGAVATPGLAEDTRAPGLIPLPAVEPVVRDTLAALAARDGELARPLLPEGTRLDALAWDGNVLVVELTLPDTPDARRWQLSVVDMQDVSQSLSRPFVPFDTFGGTRVRIRRGADSAYGTLADFLPPPAARFDPGPERQADADVVPVPAGGGTRGLGGPTVNAARQPTGALSGVVVFASAGHGWTAGDSDWFLQRPIQWDMNEDHGNLDMLNYFVHFAFNAGATVVPLKPVGWQPIEVVLDQDDPGVTYTGTWSDSSNPQYYENGATVSGVSYRFAAANTTETSTARYTPDIPVSDYYPVYTFVIASDNRTLQTYRIAHTGGISEVTIDHRQVGNGWIWLGTYYFAAGTSGYVEITNASPEPGFVIADAIRWGCGMGDVVRPGPGTTSGYPRDEEAQRYWGESEWGNNAVGFPSSIYDVAGLSDQSDNVGTGARIAREMNRVPPGGVLVDRWKRVHIEFHTNASGGTARGQLCLITDTGATTYQTQYATILSDEIDHDLSLIDSAFEHPWFDRFSPTFTGSYGAISTGNNGNEFDATIVELAFHDNQQDAELLRDPRVRRAMARAVLHGIIRFLNSLSNSQVPLAFPPDTPRDVYIRDLGTGDVEIHWQPPLADDARGDPATGYVVYESSDGYGFGDPIVLGNVLSTTVSVPAGQTRYFRVAATNAGGESMPSEVLAARRPASGSARVLIVNGYDRLRRQINPIETFDHPPAYAGQSIERQVWPRANAFNYTVQHAEALAANDVGFVTASNEAVQAGAVLLDDYDVVVWILGRESTEDQTFSSLEQSKVTTYLENGGALFVSGSEIGFDLIAQGTGVSFAQDTLRFDYVADDAGTTSVTAVAGSIFDGVSGFDFDPANGAPYEVRFPDELAPGGDASACLMYAGGTGGVAGVQVSTPIYNAVVFGFPFETITSPTARAELMGRIIPFLQSSAGPLPFDFDRDGDVDFQDFQVYVFCSQGPDNTYAPGHLCLEMDGDGDADVDLADFALFQRAFTGP